MLKPDRPGDPRFGRTHHPLIPQTKLSKQVSLATTEEQNDSLLGKFQFSDMIDNQTKKEEQKVSKKSSQSHYFTFDEVKDSSIKSMPLLQKVLKRKHLENKKRQLDIKLSNDEMTPTSRDNARRELWCIKGQLDHGLCRERLTEICQTYERINLVPEGYMYAPLYLHK